MKMDDKRNNGSTIIVKLHVHLHGSKSFLLRKPEKCSITTIPDNQFDQEFIPKSTR